MINENQLNHFFDIITDKYINQLSIAIAGQISQLSLYYFQFNIIDHLKNQLEEDIINEKLVSN